jgi:hypothetical protein
MKRVAWAAALVAAGGLFAQDGEPRDSHRPDAGAVASGQVLAVFGRSEYCALEPGPESFQPTEPTQIAFLREYRADRAREAPYEQALDLVNPPAWGKTVSPRTHGELRYHAAFPGGFACRLSLEGLAPDHAYILTLNGNPARDGNNLLSTPVPSNERERYYDFLVVKTDSRGGFDARLGVFLQPGAYDVRCYVKDTSDFKIVLYRDFFRFTVN